MSASVLDRVAPPLARAWSRWSRRERFFVLAAVGVVVFGGGWAWCWQPMRADIERMERDRVRTARVLAAAQAQADDLATLQRAAAPARPTEPRAALERVLAERGLRAGAGALDTKEGRTRVTLDAVRFTDLVAILDGIARTDGLRVVDATLATRIEPGVVRAELVFVR
jgi:type II secretory pathway component PulM